MAKPEPGEEMKPHTKKSLYKHIRTLLLILTSLSAYPSWARPYSDQIVIVPSSKLPKATQRPSVAMFLHYASCDASYLYLEQENGKRLEIIDITDPSRIRFKSDVILDSSVPFDFVQPLGRHTELIHYHDASGFAVLNLQNPKLPKLQSVDTKNIGTQIEPAIVQPSMPSTKLSLQNPVNAQDYLLIDTNRSEKLTTIKAVRQQITDEPSGATYLLGQDGLTVLRNPKMEASNLPCSRYSNDYDER
jgi:hypothetical protein